MPIIIIIDVDQVRTTVFYLLPESNLDSAAVMGILQNCKDLIVLGTMFPAALPSTPPYLVEQHKHGGLAVSTLGSEIFHQEPPAYPEI